MSNEKLAQLTQELLPLCRLEAKPVIIKIEELFLEKEKNKQEFIEWLEKEQESVGQFKNSDEWEWGFITGVEKAIEKAKEML